MKRQVLTEREKETEKILIATLPEYTIRANMRLTDVIKAGRQFRYMSSYHLDFTICDEEANPIAAVELDDSTHDTEDGRRKDANKNRWLEEANLKLIRIRKPEEAHQIRELIQNYTPPAIPETYTAPATPTRPTPKPTQNHTPPTTKAPKSRQAKKKFTGVITAIATTALLMFFVPKIINNMGNTFIKQANESGAQATKTLNALKAQQIASQVAITGQPAPGTIMVFVKGKTLKECAPNNYINETALRCTKDHYEPRTVPLAPINGNH